MHQARIVNPEQLGRLAAPGDAEDRDLGRVHPGLARQPAQGPGEVLQRDARQRGRQPRQAEVGHAEHGVPLAGQHAGQQGRGQAAIGPAEQEHGRPAARPAVAGCSRPAKPSAASVSRCMLCGTAPAALEAVRATVAPLTRTVTVNVNAPFRLQKYAGSLLARIVDGSDWCMDQIGPIPETPW